MIQSATARLRTVYLGALAGITITNMLMPVPITAYLCLIALAIGLTLPMVWTGNIDATWRVTAIIQPAPYETVLCWGCCYPGQDRDAPLQFLAHLDAEACWRCDVTDARLLPPDCWTRVSCPVGADAALNRQLGGMIRSGEPT